MTTEATEAPQPAQPAAIDAVEVYRSLERLEAGQELNKELLIRLEQRIDRQEQRADRQEERSEQRYREVNRRIDRLTYTIFGGMVALGVALILQNVFGG